MKILHVIPAAFDYYDDIKSAAFAIVDTERELGFEAEAITIEYQGAARVGGVGDKATPAPTGRRYQGSVSLATVEKDLASYTCIHAHVPIFGAVGKIIAWCKRFPQLSLMVTVHRPSMRPDFLSLFLALYNRVMLKKLFSVARYITTPNLSMFYRAYDFAVHKNIERVVEVNDSDTFLGESLAKNMPQIGIAQGRDRLAIKYILLYTSIESTQ